MKVRGWALRAAGTVVSSVKTTVFLTGASLEETVREKGTVITCTLGPVPPAPFPLWGGRKCPGAAPCPSCHPPRRWRWIPGQPTLCPGSSERAASLLAGGSRQPPSPRICLQGLSLVLSEGSLRDGEEKEPPLEEDSGDADALQGYQWLLRDLPRLPLFESVRNTTALALQQVRVGAEARGGAPKGRGRAWWGRGGAGEGRGGVEWRGWGPSPLLTRARPAGHPHGDRPADHQRLPGLSVPAHARGGTGPAQRPGPGEGRGWGGACEPAGSRAGRRLGHTLALGPECRAPWQGPSVQSRSQGQEHPCLSGHPALLTLCGCGPAWDAQGPGRAPCS